MFLILLVLAYGGYFSELNNLVQKYVYGEESVREKKLAIYLRSDVQSLVTRLQGILFSDDIQEHLKMYNHKHKKLSLRDIIEKDLIWQKTNGEHEEFTDLLKSVCSETLKSFQDKEKLVAEIFVTDIKGVSVCMSQLTHDYYQGDEAWWIKGYNSGKGELHLDEKKRFDNSAITYGYNLIIPMINREKMDEVIGVVKVFLDSDALKHNVKAK